MPNLAMLAAVLIASAGDRPDLTGTIVARGGGPVVGAHVLIDEAGARQGSSPLGPSAHADCGKRAETGPGGAFRIEEPDPALLFRVLVVAEGFRPQFVERVDPARGPIRAELVPFNVERVPADRVIRGRVVDAAGLPVAGATVEPLMFRTEEHSGFKPGVFDLLAVADLDGEFALVARSPIRDATIRVAGRGLAPRIFARQAPAPTPARYELGPGAAVAGRLIGADGRPIGGVSVGLVQANRSSDQFLGPLTIGTDGDGRFTFPNVGPGEAYFVYGIMASFGGRGAVAARRVAVGAEGSTAEMGDLAAEAGHKLGGQVLLADGRPIPPGTRVLVGRAAAWDDLSALVDADGRFALAGLPTEQITLGVPVRGYRLSPRNKSLDTTNTFQLKGTVDADLTGLKVLLEPE